MADMGLRSRPCSRGGAAPGAGRAPCRLVDAWEGFNEPVAGDEGQMASWPSLEAGRVRLLAEKGLRAAVGNFGVGTRR